MTDLLTVAHVNFVCMSVWRCPLPYSKIFCTLKCILL